jgi:hypothetical protein
MSSTDLSTNSSTDGVPTYIGGGDPAGRFTDYYPAWLDHLADDVTIEGSLLDGAAQGAEAIRMIVGTIRRVELGVPRAFERSPRSRSGLAAGPRDHVPL